MRNSVSHRPMLDPRKVEEHYSKKDKVPIKYVCTSALGGEARAMDIFYRETPHPEFGNRYFGLFFSGGILITNADRIEDVKFDMVSVDDQWHYSQHRHDFYTIRDVSIDGGRAYFKIAGNLIRPTKTFRVKDGEFIEDSGDGL